MNIVSDDEADEFLKLFFEIEVIEIVLYVMMHVLIEMSLCQHKYIILII